ncbi:MFS transporter, partial [bacterium]|nr:MFS transporter [bacterium]
DSDVYKQGIQLANDCLAQSSIAGLLAGMAFLWLGRHVSSRTIHAVSLILGSLTLFSVNWLREPSMLILSFTGIGIASASIVSMPYAMIAGVLPAHRVGVYMGIFNFFIVIPQILIAVILSRAMEHFHGFNRMSAVLFGAGCLLVASFLTFRLKKPLNG